MEIVEIDGPKESHISVDNERYAYRFLHFISSDQDKLQAHFDAVLAEIKTVLIAEAEKQKAEPQLLWKEPPTIEWNDTTQRFHCRAFLMVNPVQNDVLQWCRSRYKAATDIDEIKD